MGRGNPFISRLDPQGPEAKAARNQIEKDTFIRDQKKFMRMERRNYRKAYREGNIGVAASIQANMESRGTAMSGAMPAGQRDAMLGDRFERNKETVRASNAHQEALRREELGIEPTGQPAPAGSLDYGKTVGNVGFLPQQRGQGIPVPGDRVIPKLGEPKADARDNDAIGSFVSDLGRSKLIGQQDPEAVRLAARRAVSLGLSREEFDSISGLDSKSILSPLPADPIKSTNPLDTPVTLSGKTPESQAILSRLSPDDQQSVLQKLAIERMVDSIGDKGPTSDFDKNRFQRAFGASTGNPEYKKQLAGESALIGAAGKVKDAASNPSSLIRSMLSGASDIVGNASSSVSSLSSQLMDKLAASPSTPSLPPGLDTKSWVSFKSLFEQPDLSESQRKMSGFSRRYRDRIGAERSDQSLEGSLALANKDLPDVDSINPFFGKKRRDAEKEAERITSARERVISRAIESGADISGIITNLGFLEDLRKSEKKKKK